MSDRRPFRRRAVEALSSLKLSIFLFFALAGTSIFGTVIQQQADPEAYVASYGTGAARVIGFLGLSDMYHSWWFELLLALLLVNTLVCSLRRLPAALRAIRRHQHPGLDGLRTKGLSESWAASEGAEATVEEVLAARFGRPRARRADGVTSWFAQRQPWARLGAYVAHGSLVLFFLGGIVGARYGFKGFVNIVEGQSVGAIQLRSGETMTLPFEVACDAFELERYPDGRPKDYRSRLVVRRGDRTVQEKTIEVNHPLIQDGIYFYQSSYGQAGGGGAVLRVLDLEGKRLGPELRVAEEQTTPIPGTDLAVEVVATAPDFDGFGPAAQLVLVARDAENHAHVGEPFVVLQNFPDFDRRRGGDQVFQLAAVQPGRWYTGLQVARDPGVPLIWAAATLLTLGTLMAFFASHRRVWVHLEGGRLTVAGAAAKNVAAFRETFRDLAAALRERTEHPEPSRQAAG